VHKRGLKKKNVIVQSAKGLLQHWKWSKLLFKTKKNERY